MLKAIYDKAFKYIYLEKNNDMIESGSEHIPYTKKINPKIKCLTIDISKISVFLFKLFIP